MLYIHVVGNAVMLYIHRIINKVIPNDTVTEFVGV